MPKKKEEIIEEIEQVEEEEQVEEQEVPEVDITQPQPGDTPEKIMYRKLIADYKLQNPKKFEQKKEAFAKKLEGNIRVEENKASKRRSFYFN